MPLNRQTVLILSADPAFARELTAHWFKDSAPPGFTVLDQGIFLDLKGSSYDLAIADASSPELRAVLKQALSSTAKPALLIHGDDACPFVQTEGAVIEIHRGRLPQNSPPQDGSSDSGLWAEIAGLAAREILRRLLAESRQHAAESVCAAAEVEATLGRYMVEMRHNVNNALTSVLGNSELLTIEPGLPRSVVEQADTIHNMALRLHEIFQRFSSIEKELSVAAKELGKAHAAAASGR